jgi:hypothetical protein
MNRIALFAAFALLVAGCATPRPFLAPILKQAGPNSLGHYVGSRRDKGAPVIETGSAARGEAAFDPAAAALCRNGPAFATAQVKVCSQNALEDATLDWWIADFAGALDALNRKVFGDDPAVVLDMTLYAAEPGAKIDFVRRTALDGNKASLAFVTRTTLLREPMRRVVSQSFAHESFHAILRTKRLLAGGDPHKSPLTELLLEESAAEFFGLCGSLYATNLAVRAEANHDYAGRSGGVLRDAELRSLLAGDFEERRPALSRYEVNVIAEMTATTIWSDAIGPLYVAEADRAEGRAILSLCTQENLATPDGFRAWLTRIAEDGVDAAPLPPFENEVRSAYFQRYRDAIVRRRADQAERGKELREQAPM